MPGLTAKPLLSDDELSLLLLRPSSSSPLVDAATTCSPELPLAALNGSLQISGPGLVLSPTTAYTDLSELDRLAVAIACLHAFVQLNWTGPALELPTLPLLASTSSSATEDQLNDAAVEALAYAGEPVYHLTKKAAWLFVALELLGVRPSSSATTAQREWTLESVKIWRLWAGIVWLRCLDEPAPLPEFVTADATALRAKLGDNEVLPRLTLSLALLDSLLAKTMTHATAHRLASKKAREAATEAGLGWLLTGRMGRKTKWQIDEKSQLVLLARDGSAASATKEAAKVPEALMLNDDTLLEQVAFTGSEAAAREKDEDALGDLDPADQPTLTPLSQAILLSLAVSSLPQPTSLLQLSADVLSTEQIVAFVSRVLGEPANWSVHSMALLLRSRGEMGRSRTVERGVLQLQALVDQLRDGGAVSALSSAVKVEDQASARERLEMVHSLALPSAWDFERELATRYLTLGASKSAMEIFERLELWEDVAKCWVSLERPQKAIDVVKALLEGNKTVSDDTMVDKRSGVRLRGGKAREASLWCILGELERSAAHYEKAWEVSGQSSSRAKRALGMMAFQVSDYAGAATAFRQALAINPLYPKAWFVLGCAEMRLQDWEGAQNAFGRAVGMEEDDAEAWNNLASCHLRRAEADGEAAVTAFDPDATVLKDDDDDEEEYMDEEAAAEAKLPFSRRRAAFHCLKQAVKHSYDSWRIWTNYMVVSVDVGELPEACRALGRVVELRASKDGEGAVDLDVLDRLVNAATSDTASTGLKSQVASLIAAILAKISNSPRLYTSQAKLFLAQGDTASALGAHLKAYRCGVAQDERVESDLAAFREAAQKVTDLVSLLENLGPREGKDGKEVMKDWKWQAKSIVRSFLGRTKTSFGEEKETEDLKEVVKAL